MSSEQELIELIRQGNVDALASYLETVRRPLLAYVERQLGAGLRRKLEAEDIVQEVGADAVRSLSSVDLREREVFGWLCQIAERRIIDAHRRFFEAQKRSAGREVSLDGPAGGDGEAGLINLLVASMTTPSQAFSRDARELRVQAALAQLPPPQQEALKMRYMENLPSKEIAERMGKTDAAVRVLLTRSLKRLQEVLERANP